MRSRLFSAAGSAVFLGLLLLAFSDGFATVLAIAGIVLVVVGIGLGIAAWRQPADEAVDVMLTEAEQNEFRVLRQDAGEVAAVKELRRRRRGLSILAAKQALDQI